MNMRERYAVGFIDHRALVPTQLVPNPWAWLAEMMARVVTPYAPCTDLASRT